MDLKTILILNYCFYNSFEIKEDKTRIFGWHHEFDMSQGWASIGDANTQRSKMTLYIFEKNKQTNKHKKKERTNFCALLPICTYFITRFWETAHLTLPEANILL